MVTMLDKFGRILIPKKVRDDLGLKPGMSLDVKEESSALVLTPQFEKPEVILKEGLLVFTGEATEDIENAVGQHRKMYLEKMSAM
ncbi:Antitoxin to Toxin 1, PIN domain [hydrothermal vent metagenome]|uniref:Antitoxin to Toxin 1, PIN domain n=1 Tax=hydrothermal vent metagenome TaxID=652676 RepID=A0A3B1E1F5_9ZZZZ